MGHLCGTKHQNPGKNHTRKRPERSQNPYLSEYLSPARREPHSRGEKHVSPQRGKNRGVRNPIQNKRGEIRKRTSHITEKNMPRKNDAVKI